MIGRPSPPNRSGAGPIPVGPCPVRKKSPSSAGPDGRAAIERERPEAGPELQERGLSEPRAPASSPRRGATPRLARSAWPRSRPLHGWRPGVAGYGQGDGNREDACAPSMAGLCHRPAARPTRRTGHRPRRLILSRTPRARHLPAGTSRPARPRGFPPPTLSGRHSGTREAPSLSSRGHFGSVLATVVRVRRAGRSPWGAAPWIRGTAIAREGGPWVSSFVRSVRDRSATRGVSRCATARSSIFIAGARP